MKNNKLEVRNIDYKELYEESKFLIEHYKQLITTLSFEIKNLKNTIEKENKYKRMMPVASEMNSNHPITSQNLFS